MTSTSFFEELQQHSDAKLRILDNYIVEWMRKVTLGYYGQNALVIDGFAGSGDYDNGNDGSSIRLIKKVVQFCEQCIHHKWNAPTIFVLLIEANEKNYKKLIKNINDLINLDLADKNTFESIPAHPTVKIACVNESFSDTMTSLLKEVERGQTLMPSFCFIDPFGFKDTPFSIISKYLENSNSEIFFNFIYEETNRFINAKNKKIQEHMSKHFGIEEIDTLQKLVSDKPPLERKQLIVDFYSRQLLENTDVKFVFTFEIKKNGRTKLILFYGTRNEKGLKAMKKAMWKVDDTGLYMFDDRKKSTQIEFEFVKELAETELIQNLAKQISIQFKSRKVVVPDIESYVITQTIYPVENYMKSALKLLEIDGLILDVVKPLNKKRNKGTFADDCTITFK